VGEGGGGEGLRVLRVGPGVLRSHHKFDPGCVSNSRKAKFAVLRVLTPVETFLATYSKRLLGYRGRAGVGFRQQDKIPRRNWSDGLSWPQTLCSDAVRPSRFSVKFLIREPPISDLSRLAKGFRATACLATVQSGFGKRRSPLSEGLFGRRTTFAYRVCDCIK
jgi:hypothetical protein